jgi:protein SCO1
MNRNSVAIVSIFTALILPFALPAQDGMHHHHHPPDSSQSQPVSVSGLTIPDIELINQRGEKVRFYSGLVQGKIVAINTIFTTCTTICPPMGANFSKLRKMLGDHAGRDVNLISISVDPAVDTPERLDEWSRKFGEMGPGWTLLTGATGDVNTVLKALQVFTSDKQDHEPIALIGGDAAGDWIRASALLRPARLDALIRTKLDFVAAHRLSGN